MKTTLIAFLSFATVYGSPTFAADATASIGAIAIKEIEGAKSQRNFTMTVPIKLRSKEKIDPRNLMLRVNFYDLVNGKPAPTSAEIFSRWKTSPTNWEDGGTELFEVELRQSGSAAKSPEESHKYFGYLVHVYYQNELQVTRAEPSSLAKTFPAPQILKAQAAR